MEKVSIDIKDIVFDYFNIITKEYEMSYEKYRNDDDYQNQLKELKSKIDKDYVEGKFDVPKNLTKQKTIELIRRKEKLVSEQCMQMIQSS